MIATIATMALQQLGESHPDVAASILSIVQIAGEATVTYKSGAQTRLWIEGGSKRYAKVDKLVADLVRLGIQ